MRPIKKPIRPNVINDDDLTSNNIVENKSESNQKNPFSHSRSNQNIQKVQNNIESPQERNNATQENTPKEKEDINKVNENNRHPKGNSYTYSFTSQKHSKLIKLFYILI